MAGSTLPKGECQLWSLPVKAFCPSTGHGGHAWVPGLCRSHCGTLEKSCLL